MKKKLSDEQIKNLVDVLDTLDWEMVFLSHQDLGDDQLEIDGKPVGGIVIGSGSFIKEVVPKVSDLSKEDIEQAFTIAEESEDGIAHFEEILKKDTDAPIKPPNTKPKKNDPTFH